MVLGALRWFFIRDRVVVRRAELYKECIQKKGNSILWQRKCTQRQTISAFIGISHTQRISVDWNVRYYGWIIDVRVIRTGFWYSSISGMFSNIGLKYWDLSNYPWIGGVGIVIDRREGSDKLFGRKWYLKVSISPPCGLFRTYYNIHIPKNHQFSGERSNVFCPEHLARKMIKKKWCIRMGKTIVNHAIKPAVDDL